ncbi:MAG: crotonase/enoyl-CoA hydratase family protein [Pseudomonadota bacterium]
MSVLTMTLDDGVAVIRIDDGKANAVSQDFIAEMHAALDETEKSADAVVIVGRPGRFSAGFDLKVMMNDPAAAGDLVTAGGQLFTRIFEYPKPVIAACTGHALAAGALLLLACDTRIGTKGDYKLGLNETAIGMTLPDYGIILPQARLEPRHFTSAVIQAKIHSPEEAVEAGFLDAVADEGALEETAMAAANALKALPGSAYAGNKRKIRAEAIAALHASFAS